MKGINYLFAASSILLMKSCGGSDDGNGGPNPEPIPNPSAATLIFPDNNAECNEGSILSDTESEVTFRWNASQNTDSYTVNLRNLDTDGTQQLNANTNELAIRLNRGTPYSWSVTSRANGTDETAESSTWRFYNAGLGIENYSPFPADNPSPKSGASIDSGTINLSWEGSDLDGDIASYEVLLDTANPPIASEGSTTENLLQVELATSGVYYWRVITIDETNNSSRSEIFQFRVN